jgi:MFS family permease
MHIISTEKAFISFVIKRFVFLTGTTLAIPLFPIYFVRVVNASNSWIAGITTAQTAVMVIGYFYWTRKSRASGARPVLIWTTMGMALYPIFVAATTEPWVIVVLAGTAGIFQAGLDLVFFDELMNTIPPEFSATFVSFAQSLQYLSSIVSPLVGTFLADQFGVGTALIVAGAIRMIGCLMFLFSKPVAKYSGA